MPFTALFDMKIINALNFSQSQWEDHVPAWREKEALLCRECKERMTPVSAVHVRKHFRHIPMSNPSEDFLTCSLRVSESDEHLFLKEYMAKALRKLGYSPQMETKIGNRRADICLPKEHKVFEIQLSNISHAEINQRHYDYMRHGYRPLWVLWKAIRPSVPNIRLVLRHYEDDELSPTNRASIPIANEHLADFDIGKYSDAFKEIRVEQNILTMTEMMGHFITGNYRYSHYCDFNESPHWCAEDCKAAMAKLKSQEHEEKMRIQAESSQKFAQVTAETQKWLPKLLGKMYPDEFPQYVEKPEPERKTEMPF